MRLKKAYYIATIGNRGEKAGGCKPLGKAKERKHRLGVEKRKSGQSIITKLLQAQKHYYIEDSEKQKTKVLQAVAENETALSL